MPQARSHGPLLLLLQMLDEHLSQFPLTVGQAKMRGDGGGFGYVAPGYYFLGAALHAVRRRKTAEKLLQGVSSLYSSRQRIAWR